MTWDKCGVSRFTHYTTHVAPNCNTIFFTERGNHTHRYMLEPIPLSTIRTIASMWLSSHALRCEMGRWGLMRVVDCAHFPLNKFESLSITLWYNAFDHTFHTSSTKPNPCTNFSIATFIGKVLEHRESLLTFTCITWNVIFWSHRSYFTSEEDNRVSLSLSLSIFYKDYFQRHH